MPECHLRIRSDDDVVLNSIVLWCRTQAKVYLAVKEIGKKDGKHIHTILDTNLSISRFRQLLIEKFPILHGNRSYSVKKFEKDLDHNIRYCCKGTQESSPVVLFTILTESEIEEAHKKFWEEQKKYLIEHGVKPVDKPTKTTRSPTFKEKILASLPVGVAAAYSGLKSMYKRTDYEEHELRKVQGIIVDTVILSFGKYGKDLDDNILTKNVNGVLLKCMTDYGNDHDKKYICSLLTNRISHNLI